MTARRVTVSPLRDFFHAESAGGIVLVIATITALVWANSPWKQSYFELWHTHLSIALGSHSIDLTLEQWVNEGLMTIFFLVVGLEIKRELVEGELRDPRTAALPAIAAVGGMIVPALIYVAINAGGNGAGGWGIPMATDIAMAIGVVSLLGSRVPPSLKLFLLPSRSWTTSARSSSSRSSTPTRSTSCRCLSRSAFCCRLPARADRHPIRSRHTSRSARDCGWRSTTRACTRRWPASSWD